jgi:hypothetical protein
MISSRSFMKYCGSSFGGVVGIAFEFHLGNDFLHDNAADSARFGVPFDVIATFERPGHLSSLPNGRCIPPSNGQEKSAVNHALDIVRNIVF